MVEAPLIEGEKKRLESTRTLNLLDTPLDGRFERITRMVCRSLDVPIAAFTLVDEARQWFKSIQGLNVSETSRSVAFCAHAIVGEEPFIVPDARLDPRFTDNPLVTNDPHIGFYAGCIVRSPDGQKIGTLCAIDRKPRNLSSEGIQALQDLALMVETELQLAVLSTTQRRLVQELDAVQRLSLVDALTRVWNRAGIMEILKREWSEATRKNGIVGLVMADIDHFKKVNDTYGHPVGDEVLQEVPRRLLSSLRTEDAGGRIGGEEFLIVLPGCQADTLLATTQRIRATVIESPIITGAGNPNITMSFGAVAASPMACDSITAAIKLADDALYRAKLAGRNCVEMSR